MELTIIESVATDNENVNKIPITQLSQEGRGKWRFYKQPFLYPNILQTEAVF